MATLRRPRAAKAGSAPLSKNGRHQATVNSSNNSACFDRSAQVAIADGVQDRVGEFASVARGAERTGARRVDRHSQAKRMTPAQEPDTLRDFCRETGGGDRRIAFRPRKRAELDIEEVLPIPDRPGRRRRDVAGENETRARGESGKKVGPKPGSCQAPSIDVVDHDDRDVLGAAKRCRKLSDRSGIPVNYPAKCRQDCRGVGSTAPAAICNRRTPSSSRHASSAEMSAVLPMPAGP